MFQSSNRFLWQLLIMVVAVFPLANLCSFAYGDNVPSDGITIDSSTVQPETYTFVSSPRSGDVRLDLSTLTTGVSASFELQTDGTIYTLNGSGKTTQLKGDSIKMSSGMELTIGDSTVSTDLGTIVINSAISGGQSLRINRGSSSAITTLSVGNSGFTGTVTIEQGILNIHNTGALNDNNSVVISKNGTMDVTVDTVSVQSITNNGNITLNGHKLIIDKDITTWGSISNGLLQFNSDLTLDDNANLDDVDIVLNNSTMKVTSDKELSSVQTASGATGTVIINENKSLTLLNDDAFGTGVTYQSSTNNDGTLIFGSEDGKTTGNFKTGTTSQFSTSSGKMITAQVNKNSTLTLGADETVNALVLEDSSVATGGNDLTVYSGIKSYGSSKITGEGSTVLGDDTDIVGSGTLEIDSLDLDSNAATITADTSSFTVKVNAVTDPGDITLNRNTVLDVDGGLATSSALNGYYGSTLNSGLTYSGTGTMTVKDGTFNISGDAKFTSGNKITMNMTAGTDSQGMPGLNVDGKLIFNTDATSAITDDSAALTTMTLSGYRSGDALTISLEAKDGIYGYGSGEKDALSESVTTKDSTISGAKGYIVCDGDQNYFQIVLDNTAGFDVNSLTYNNGQLDINLSARATSSNPIEQVIVNGVNAGNASMTTLYDKVNASANRDKSLNELNPYTVSATTSNQMWIAQEYESRTFQRTKMVRTALYGYGSFIPINENNYGAMINPEVAYLAQSYGTCPGMCCNPCFPCCNLCCGYQWWFRGIGAWEKQDADTEINAPEYSASYAGFTIGVDKLYCPNFLLGFSAGGVWNTTDFSDGGRSSAQGSTFLCDLYGSWFDNCNHFDFMFGYQGGSTDTYRRTDFGVAQTNGNVKSDSFIAAFELGHVFRYLRDTLEPYYGLQYINLQNDALTETGSEAALRIQSSCHQALLQSLGMRWMRSMPGPLKGYYFVPQLDVAWVHDYSDSSMFTTSAFADSLGSGSFITCGYRVPRDRFKVAVGLDIVFNPCTKIDIKYECQAGSGFGFHTLTGGFDWNF